MKSFGGLWERVTALTNLADAWSQFRRTHTKNFSTLRWEANIDERLRALRDELLSGEYRPGAYSCFVLFEPKPRLISRAPVKDRIVHHALCNYTTPLFERRFISQTYACRPGLGTHRACARARELARQGGYFLKLDIRHYFDTVDWDILERLLHGMFREREIRELFVRIIENRKGLTTQSAVLESAYGPRRGMPIGNLTSQWMANLYLDGLDHFAVEGMRIGRNYLRYMDDMLIFLPTAADCRAVHDVLQDWLADNRRLELKESMTRIAPVSEGVPFLGLRIWPDAWRYQRRRFRRTRRRLEQHYAAFVRGDEDGWKLQEVGRAMDGSTGWYGFRGIYRGVGEKTLAQYDLEAGDDGLPLRKDTGGEVTSTGTKRLYGAGYWGDGAGKVRYHGASGRYANVSSNNNNNSGFRVVSPERREGNVAMYPSMEPSRATCASQCGGDEHAPGDIGASSLRASAGHRPMSPSFESEELRVESGKCGVESGKTGRDARPARPRSESGT